jgi:hypothetical protein
MDQGACASFVLSFGETLSFQKILEVYINLEKRCSACSDNAPSPFSFRFYSPWNVPRGEVEYSIERLLLREDRQIVLSSLQKRFPRTKYPFTYPAAEVMQYVQEHVLSYALKVPYGCTPLPPVRERVQNIIQMRAREQF